jgi:poly(3-hydroxyoctanoate) depolymerase
VQISEITVDGTALEVSVAGSGPPLLLLNGLGARISFFDELRSMLGHYQTITFNQPGIGNSEPRRGLTMEDYARLAVRVLDRLGFVAPVDVFGVSWGGCLAQELAFRHPERVCRLILASTTPSAMLLTTPSVYAAFLSTSRYRSARNHRAIAGRLYGGPIRQQPQLMDAMLSHLDPANSQGRKSQQRAALGWTSMHYLWRLPHSTLVLAGDDDPIIRPYNAYLLSALIPRATRRILRDEGHLFPLTSARETEMRISQFLENGSGRKRSRPRARSLWQRAWQHIRASGENRSV